MIALQSSCRIYHGHGDVEILRPAVARDRDLVARRTPSIAMHVPVAEAMTREVICARKDLRLEALVPLIVRDHLGCVPVVDERGRPVGMITKLDLVERLDDPEPKPLQTAEDLMMPLAITLNEHATVAHAAAMMTLEGVHHIPVVSSAGTLIGIVSSLDVVRWLALNDGLIDASE